MPYFWSHLKKLDWILTACVVFLGLMGLASIYSSSFLREDFLNFRKQVTFLTIGFFFMVGTSFIDWRIFKDHSFLVLIIYILALSSLLFLLFVAPLTKGVKGWYKIGFISLDPVELMKIILIILLAKYFSFHHPEIYSIKPILVSGLYVLFPFILVFLQPDFGSGLILILIWLGILVVSGIKKRHLLILGLIFLVFLILSWNMFLRPYQKERIISFLFPEVGSLDAGWSQKQSKIAIGSGGLTGKGWRRGSQVQFGFLSLPQTDFIFAALAEEFGLLGICVLFFLFSIACLRIIKICYESETNFPRLFSLGFLILLASQLFVHAGMNLGILPVIGISLPFVSYGGSGLLFNFIGLGILQSFRAHKER